MIFACDIPGAGALFLDDEVLGRLCCGVVALDNVCVVQSGGAAMKTAEIAASLRQKFMGQVPSAIPGLAAARTLYKSFGMDPSRHRPSSEALLRRILKGKDLYQINSAVDSCNLASVSFLLPIGMYDLDAIRGDIRVRVGAPGDSYAGIRKGPVNVGDRIALYDDEGPFGSPTSDSARTSVHEATTRIMGVVFAPCGYTRSEMIGNLNEFADLFAAYCDAETVEKVCLGWEAQG